MKLDWQTIAVLSIVAAATAYLARTAWQTVARRKAAACASGCSSCPASNNEPAVVGIEIVSSKDAVFPTAQPTSESMPARRN